MLGENTGLEQLNLVSKDVQASYIEEIGKIIPEVLTESRDENGKLKQSIDFDKLKGLLGGELSEQAESYDFTWVGKHDAVAEAGQQTTKILRPQIGDSVNFEDTENVFITGDNLVVLKILQESYINNIDMIYIDPPYNTGNDFVYSDKFKMNEKELEAKLDMYDSEGYQVIGLTKNEKQSARFHSNWLNMMYSRLRLARNLLKESGAIFISIDDNEQSNLKTLCNEIYGENNFIANIIWEKVHTRKNSAKYFSTSHEHVLVYAKNKELWDRVLLPREDNTAYTNPDNHPKGPWKLDPITAHNEYSANYTITKPNGVVLNKPEDRYWAFSEQTIKEKIANNEIFWGDGDSYPMIKRFLSEVQDGLVPVTLFTRKFAGDTTSSKRHLDQLFEKKGVFDYSKPWTLIKRLLQISTREDSIVLDFFSGSGTTAEAVMRLNSEDRGNRKFVLCTLDEEVADKSVAKEAGYETIDQIARERIRRAAEKIKKEHPDRVGVQDFGFKAFKVASSNYKNVAATPSETTQSNLFDSVSNIKPDRTPLDLLYQVILSWGIELSIKVESMQIESNMVYNVGDGLLLACFDEAISESTIRHMAAQQPSMATFRDDAFGRSADKINLGEIFKELSPETKVKVI